jgi:hypothetical protein
LGVTSEIAARDCIVHRARGNRRAHCQTPSTNRQLYPLAVTQKLRRIVDESVAFGPLSGGLLREIALEELEDDRANLMDVGFEREMSGVVECTSAFASPRLNSSAVMSHGPALLMDSVASTAAACACYLDRSQALAIRTCVPSGFCRLITTNTAAPLAQ